MASMKFVYVRGTVFDSRYRCYLHFFEVFLIVVAMGLTVPRLFAKNQQRTRANTIALAMGAKSLIFILYQVSSEHIKRLQRWHSYKANTILNSMEIVFWAAVLVLLVQSNVRACSGYLCGLSWAVAVIAIFISIISAYTATVSFMEFKLSRRGDGPVSREKSEFDCEENRGRMVRRLGQAK